MSVCLVATSPRDKVDRAKGLDGAFARTERTGNRKGVAAVNLARERVPQGGRLGWANRNCTLFNHLKG